MEDNQKDNKGSSRFVQDQEGSKGKCEGKVRQREVNGFRAATWTVIVDNYASGDTCINAEQTEQTR